MIHDIDHALSIIQSVSHLKPINISSFEKTSIE